MQRVNRWDSDQLHNSGWLARIDCVSVVPDLEQPTMNTECMTLRKKEADGDTPAVLGHRRATKNCPFPYGRTPPPLVVCLWPFTMSTHYSDSVIGFLAGSGSGLPVSHHGGPGGSLSSALSGMTRP